jgi:hypothetical protein
VEYDCLCSASNSVSAHIRQYYDNLTTEPGIFWKFDSNILPPHARLESAPSRRGDQCHRNAHGVDDETWRAFFVNRQKTDWSHFSICDNGGHRSVTKDELRQRKMALTENNGIM